MKLYIIGNYFCALRDKTGIFTVEEALSNREVVKKLERFQPEYTNDNSAIRIKLNSIVGEDIIKLDKFYTSYIKVLGTQKAKDLESAIINKYSEGEIKGTDIVKGLTKFIIIANKISQKTFEIVIEPAYVKSESVLMDLKAYNRVIQRTMRAHSGMTSTIQKNPDDRLFLDIPMPVQIVSDISSVEYPHPLKWQRVFNSVREAAVLRSPGLEETIQYRADAEELKKKAYGYVSANKLDIQNNERDYYKGLCELQDEVQAMSKVKGYLLDEHLEKYFRNLINIIMLVHRSHTGDFNSPNSGLNIEELDTEDIFMDNDFDDESDSQSSDGMSLDVKFFTSNKRANSRNSRDRMAGGLNAIVSYINKCDSKYAWPEFIVKSLRWGERKPRRIKLEGTSMYFDMNQLVATTSSGDTENMEILGKILTGKFLARVHLEDSILRKEKGIPEGELKGFLAFEYTTIYTDKQSGKNIAEKRYISIDALIEEYLAKDGLRLSNLSYSEDSGFVVEDESKISRQELWESSIFQDHDSLDISRSLKKFFIKLGIKRYTSDLLLLPEMFKVTSFKRIEVEVEKALSTKKQLDSRDYSNIANMDLAKTYIPYIGWCGLNTGWKSSVANSLNKYYAIFKEVNDSELREPEVVNEEKDILEEIDLSDGATMTEEFKLEEESVISKVVLDKASVVEYKDKKIYLHKSPKTGVVIVYHQDRVKEVKVKIKSSYNPIQAVGNAITIAIKATLGGKKSTILIDKHSIVPLMEDLEVLV